jgi:transcriptional repressor NrdR
VRCPFCDSSDTQVKDSRPLGYGEAIRRRRFCSGCSAKFTTLERKEMPEIKVIKKLGAKKAFDTQKITNSIIVATRKRPVTSEERDKIVSRILKKIEQSGENEISSKKIGQLIMDELAEVDQVSYVRYASVYYDFSCIEDFTKFVQNTKNNKKRKED